MPPRDTWPHGPQQLARQGPRAQLLLLTAALVLQRGPPCQQAPSAAISPTQSHPQTALRSLFTHFPLITSPRGRRNGKNTKYPHSFWYLHSANLSFLGNISRNCLPGRLDNTTPRREGQGTPASTVSDCICSPGSPSPWLLTFKMSSSSFRKQQLVFEKFQVSVSCLSHVRFARTSPTTGFSFSPPLTRISAFITVSAHSISYSYRRF